MARVAILGAGVMGTALSYPLRDNGHEVHLIGTPLDEEIIVRCKQDGFHPRLRRQLASGVQAFTIGELHEGIAGVDIIAIGVSSRGVQWAAETLAPHLQPDQPVVMVTKGLWADPTGDLHIFPDVFARFLPLPLRNHVALAAIGGPSIAGELAARRPTFVVFTSRNQKTLDVLAPLFATDYYHIWTSTDMIGVEVCVALKNVYALAVGLVPGVLEASGGFNGNAAMHNYAAALFAQGLTETAQLIQLLGGRIETVFSLPGAGDLYVTCQGGRNSRMGHLLGKGTDPEDAVEQMAGETVEGVEAVTVIAPAIYKLIERRALAENALPLLRYVYDVAIRGMSSTPTFESFFRLPSLELKPVAGNPGNLRA